MCVLKCSNQVWLTLFISLTQVCSIFLHFVCYHWWWNKDYYNFTYLLACLPVVWQQAVASSGESERLSPDHSWTSSSRCFRRLAIQTSSCAKKWRWRSTSQSHVSRYTDTTECNAMNAPNSTVYKKAARTRLPSVGFRSWSRFWAVSMQVTWVINPAVGCHFFHQAPQSLSQPFRGLLSVSLLGKQRQVGCEQFA